MRFVRRFPACFVVALLVAMQLSTTTASGATRTLTFGATADAAIRSDKPSRSFGTATTLEVDNSPVRNSLLRFTVTGVGTDVVTSAALRLYVTNASPVGGTVYRVASQTWTESVTWSTAPAADPTPISSALGKAVIGSWVTFDVTSLVRGGDGTYSIRLASSSTDGADYVSREGTTATQRPQLVINAAITDITAPSVSITAPSGGATVSGQIPIAVSASDDTGVTAVDFAVDGSVLGTDTTSPYSLSWDTRAMGNGTHSLSATAHDAAGHIGTSTPVSVTVSNDTTKPTASITAPTAGASVAGATSVTVDANDNIGVTSVDVAVDGAVIGSDTSSPYEVAWDTTKTTSATHTLTAIAHDAAGNTGTSAAVQVSVSNDTAKPSASITAPTAGTGVAGQTSVTVDAGDNIGVTSVEVAVDGAVIGSDTSSPYEVAWDTTKTANGTRALTAIAHDAAGNTGTSDPVSVSVSNDTTKPTASITEPTAGTSVAGQTSVRVDAGDNIGVTSVDVALDGTVIGSDTTAPYEVAWDTTLATSATHILTAIAHDAAGNTGTSSNVSVSVNNGVVTPTSFTFAAAGDHGANAKTAASLTALDASPAAFYLALGDMDYDQTLTDAAWCDYIHAGLPTKGPSFPFEVVTGNHEEDPGPNGSILNHAACLPDRMSSSIGPGATYGSEYSFDYPAGAPLARFIMISPELTVGGTTYHYVPGNPHYDWLASTIDAAHASGIQWVIVGMHFPCLSAGQYSCAAGPQLMNLLVSKRVDLILHGHEHSYQRSKQLALDPATCPSIPASGYVPGCVADDGMDGIYPKGAGSVDVIAGTFGQGLYNTFPADPETPYFVKLGSTSHGFMQYTVTADRIDAAFTRIDGTLTDGFSIVAGAAAYADRIAPSQPTSLVASTATPGRVDLSWGASTDDVAIRNYAIFRDGLFVATTTATTFSDPSVTSSVAYTYTVSAYDTAGNPSAMSAQVIVSVPQATTLTFTPDADASLYAGSPTTNYGASAKLETDNSPVKQYLVRFTVTGVGTRTVTAAKVRLSCTDNSPSGGAFTIAASNDWVENTVNWNTAPAPGATVATLGQVVAGTTYEIDLSSLIHGDGTYTLRIVTTNADGADFASKEGSIGTRPQLIVTTGT